jgi:hypothetical protein
LFEGLAAYEDVFRADGLGDFVERHAEEVEVGRHEWCLYLRQTTAS